MTDDKPPTLRLFVAVFPPPDLAAALAAETKKFKLARGAVRWTLPKQIHLTLNFLGSVPAARLPEFAAAVAAACSHRGPHALEPVGLGAFPSETSPRIIWAGLRGDLDALGQLKETLDLRLQRLGYVSDAREFHPHLTLGRVVRLKPADRAKLPRLFTSASRSFGPWPVTRVALMRSVLSPSGAAYFEQEAFSLSAP